MPEQRILMDIRLRFCTPCDKADVKRPGDQYNITITSPDRFDAQEEVLLDESVILCAEHAGTVSQVVELVREHANPDEDPEVVRITSLEDLMRLQNERPAVLTRGAPGQVPAAPQPEPADSTPPPPVVEEMSTRETQFRCLECTSPSVHTYMAIGQHMRKHGLTSMTAKWEFADLPQSVRVTECGVQLDEGGTCQGKFASKADYEQHCRNKKHLMRA